jgi:hypothetical protein
MYIVKKQLVWKPQVCFEVEFDQQQYEHFFIVLRWVRKLEWLLGMCMLVRIGCILQMMNKCNTYMCVYFTILETWNNVF